MSSQNWSPDTCGCCIEELKDGTTVTGPGNVIRKCADHEDVPDDELYGVLYSNKDGENKRKNQLEGYLLGFGGIDFGFHEAKKNKDGSNAGVGWKPGLAYSWSFTGKGKDRVLVATVIGAALLDAQKKSIREACIGKFGSDKTVVV